MMTRRPRRSPEIKAAEKGLSDAARSIRDIARGLMRDGAKGEKAALKIARELERLAAADLRKLTPAELISINESPKAERYIQKGKRVRKGVRTASKRQYLKKQTAQREGAKPVSLEKAARQRHEGEYRYSTAASEAQAKRQSFTKRANAAERKGDRLQRVESSNPRRKARTYKIKNPGRYKEVAMRKLDGDYLDDGDWHLLVDIARGVGDPRLPQFLKSPPTKGGEDEGYFEDGYDE
jgi:hypothetical protein